MLEKAKSAVKIASDFVLPAKTELTAHDVAPARQYIARYWKELERFHPKDDKTLVGLPYPYLIPSNDVTYGFDELYY